MERYPYFYEKTVEDSDCFPNLTMRPSSALVYIQRAATNHLSLLGYGYEKLFSMGIVFVVANSATQFIKFPAYGEKVKVATCPAVCKGAQMIRETVIMDQNEKVLVENQSAWVMLNPQTKKILRPKDLPFSLPMLTCYTPFFDVTKVKIPQGEKFIHKREVRLSDIDRNLHMNNTVYASLLTDCFPQEVLSGKMSSMFIKYKQQAKLGQEFSLFGGNDEENFFVAAQNQGEMYFQGMFTLNK